MHPTVYILWFTTFFVIFLPGDLVPAKKAEFLAPYNLDEVAFFVETDTIVDTCCWDWVPAVG